MRIAMPGVSKCAWSETSKYIVQGLRIDGKKVRRFFPTRVAAETWLRLTLARQKTEGESAPLTMPEALRVEAMACAEKLKPYGKTLTDAVEALIAHAKIVNRSCTVSALIVEFLANAKARKNRDRYVKDMRNRLTKFERKFGERTVAEIRRSEIIDWLTGLGVGIQAKNNYRSVLRTFWKFALSKEYAVKNPVDGIEKVKVERPPVEVFTPAEMQNLLASAPSDFIPWLAIGGFAGLRSAEIEKLDWSEISLAERLIKLPADKSKTRKKRNVQISENLAAWLQPLAKKEGQVAEPQRIRVARSKTCAAAKVAWKDNALRHSFGSYHLAHGQDAPKTAYQLGHSNPRMLGEHYDAVTTQAEAAKWWAIMPPPPAPNVVVFTGRAANA